MATSGGLFALLCLAIITGSYADDSPGVIRETWTDVMGDSLQNLLADVRFPHKPSNVHYLKNFDSPVNNGTAYAQRLKGYFIAPESGQYKFYSSCDDECEVFLGLDGKEGENNKIIGQKRASLHNEFDRYPDQVSHTVHLDKGKAYYVEAIGKQTEGADSLSVGVQLPSGKKLLPIPRKYLKPVKLPNGYRVIRPRKSKSKKNKKRRSQKTEMAEGNLEQFLSGVTASKKTIKDKDVKEKFYGMTEPQYPQFGSGIGHALLDIEGAEFTEGDGMEPGVSILPFDEDSKGNGEYRQMFTLGNDEELEGHKQQGKKPGDHPAAVSSNKTEDSTYDYSAAAKSTENASSNEKVAEANKLNSDYNSVPLNLANISNFKVVIPGGKTYEISRAGGNQPAVTVVPNEETKSDEQASQKYQKSTPKDTSVDTNKDGSTASASSSPSSDSFNEKDTSVKDTAARDADTKTKGVSSTDTSLSTPASAATSSSDIKSVEKASSEKSTDKIPNTDTKTVTEDSSGKNKETTANKEASARQGTMGFETYASPQGAGESVMAFDGADHGGHDMDHPPFHLETQPMTLHVPIEQPVLHASHIEHPIIHEEPIEQPVVHEPVLMHHEEHYPNPPVIHHEDHPPIHEMPHHDDMHVVVEQHVPPPPKPNVTKIEPEIIKVEFLPEGVGVDTAAAKMKASGGGGFIKGKEKTKEVKIVPAASTSSATQDKSATAPDTPKPAAQQAAAVSSKGEVTETKPTAKEIVSKALMEAAAEGLKVQKAESETQSATLSKASKNAAQIEKPQYEAQPVSVQFASEDKSKTQPEAQPATLQLASEEKSKALSEAQPETLQPISDDKSSPKDTKESLKDVNTITTSAISPGNDPQTVSGSVLNNATGKNTPFEVTVVSDPKQVKAAARGSSGNNYTIKAGNKDVASVISTNEPGKKGHQSVVVLSKERKEKEEKVNPIAVKMSDDYDRTETFPSKVESRLNEEGPSEMGREPYPESLPSRFEANPKSGPVFDPSSRFPQGRTAGPSGPSEPSGPSGASGPSGSSHQSNNNHPPVIQEGAPHEPEPEPVPDKVLVSPPTNVYKGPLISPVATTFMDDLGKGVISPEEALQLMNNYVSGSQDMTQSIKQLGSMLPHQSFPGGDPRIDTRGTARGQASPSFSAPPQFSAPPSFAAPPSFSAPPSLSASPSNSEIASILAHGPQNLPDMQSMSSMSGPQLNLIDHPEGEPYPMHGDQGASHGPGFGPMMGPESGPGHGFGPDEEQNRFLAERNFEPEHHFGPDEHYEPERPREFEHSPHMDNDLPAVNQMSPDGKPDPIHVYQKGDLLDEFREHPNRHLTLPGLEGEHRIGERPSSMFADEGPRFSPEMNSFHSPRIQTGIARQMDPANMFRQAPPPPNQFEPIPSHQDVEKFINNMDPHERSSNPNLATPEVDFPRQTANIEMPERSVGTSDFASHNMGPSTFPETSMGSSYAGLSPMANEPLQSPSVTSPEANIPQSIAMEYASIRSGQPYVGARIPSRQPFAEPHPQQESLPQFHQPQIRQQIQPEAPSNVPVMNHPHISDAYTDSLFPEDLADIESLKGSLQGKTLSMYDSEGEAQQQRGQSRSNLNHGNPQAPSGGGSLRKKTKIAGSSGIKSKRHQKSSAKVATSLNKSKLKSRKPRSHLFRVKLQKPRNSVTHKKLSKTNKSKRAILAQSKIIPLQASNRLQLPKIIPGQRKSTGAPEPKFKGKTQVFGQSTGADDLENGQANRRDSDKEHLQKIAQELQDILHQLHNTKSAQYYVWSGDTFGHTPDTETKTLGSRYEVHYLHGKVTDEDLMAERPFINSAPDAERFQQDVWEPGSRGGGEGNLLGGLLHKRRTSSTGLKNKVKTQRKSKLQRVPKDKIARVPVRLYDDRYAKGRQVYGIRR